MKGLEIAMTVRMNQDGWVMIRDFRFFLSLRMKIEAVYLNFLKSICIKVITISIPSVDHLIALLEPANAGHLAPRRSSIHVYDQVILCHQHLQTAHHIPEEQVWRQCERVKRSQIRKSQNKKVVQSGLAVFAKSNKLISLQEEVFHQVMVIWAAAVRKVTRREHNDGVQALAIVP